MNVVSDSPFSSENRKKIKRKFFKADVAVKSYKCNFIDSAINTQAKVYICANAVHVVHRPKRRKLTTVPFTGILNIKALSDGESLALCICTGVTYTLTKFERPESAIAFILNFWNMVRKEKIMSRYSSSCITSPGTLSTTSADVCSSFPNNLAMLKAPTTISLNSSTSFSEAESFDGQKPQNSAKVSVCSQFSEPLLRVSSSRSVGNSTTDLRINKAMKNPNVSGSQEKVLHTLSIARSTRSSAVSSPAPVHSSSNSSGPLRVNADCLVTQRPPSVLRNTPSSPSRLPPVGTDQQLVSRPSNVILRPNPLKQKTVVCLSEASGWMTSPLSFLPYPFSSPPRRLTIAIAYVILAFLLFSTMHLYHRLAVFDFHGSRLINMDAASSRTSHTELPRKLKSVESDLSQLVLLTEQLTHSLLRLTAELQSLSPFRSQSSENAAVDGPAVPPP